MLTSVTRRNMNRAGCGPSMMCSLESCLSAGVTAYWQMWVTDNITSLCIKKTKKPRRNLFNKVCIRATSRGLWADAGRPEFSHCGKVINMLYIDVVLLVIGLLEIISTLPQMPLCVFMFLISGVGCISFDQSLSAGCAKHADVSPFGALRNIMVTFRSGVWNEKVTSKRSYVISCLYSWFGYFYAFVSFFCFCFWSLTLQILQLADICGAFFWHMQASKQRVACCCCVAGFAMHRGIKLHV